MIRAIVFDTTTPFRTKTPPLTKGGPGGVAPSASIPGFAEVPPDSRLAGLTLVRRAVLSAWRAGASEAVIVARDAEAAARWSASEQKLPIPVQVITPDQPLPDAGADDTLLIQAAQIHTSVAGLEALVQAAADLPRGMALADAGQTLPALARGMATASAADLAAAIARPESRSVALPAGSVRALDSLATLRVVDRDMYRGLTSISDGYIDRVFNRHISGWFTRRIINLPVTPNGVTWLHFSLGMLGAWLFWQGQTWQVVLGAFLFQLSVALDCSDGEVARLKFQFSKFGSWLDVVTDNIVTIAVFVAVARSVYVRYGTHLGLTLGALMVTGVLMCIVVVFTMAKLQERRRPGEASTLSVTNRLSSSDQGKAEKQTSLVDAVINEATSRDFSVLVVACALTGRLDWFAWLAAIGSHVFWVVFAAIQWSMLRRSNG
ncbi:MAG: CDP-alcohol phosphatidyltransferase family protein [Actinomycetota bacterium]